jgi:hypothetical protein
VVVVEDGIVTVVTVAPGGSWNMDDAGDVE